MLVKGATGVNMIPSEVIKMLEGSSLVTNFNVKNYVIEEKDIPEKRIESFRATMFNLKEKITFIITVEFRYSLYLQKNLGCT